MQITSIDSKAREYNTKFKVFKYLKFVLRLNTNILSMSILYFIRRCLTIVKQHSKNN